MEKELNIINPDDKEYYDGKFYMVGIYPGAGVQLADFYVYASHEEEALELVVAHLDVDNTNLLYTTDEIDNLIFEDYADEYNTFVEENPEVDTFQFATEYLGYIYVDATMQGASQPYFVEGNNLRIEETNDEPIVFGEKWTDVYKQFEEIVERVGLEEPNSEFEIERQIEELYNKHKGEYAWDEAYKRWLESGSDELNESKKEEFYNKPDEEVIIWDSEVDYYDEERVADVKANQYQDYLDDLDAEEEPQEFEEWYQEYIMNFGYEDAELVMEDLEENILPEIDKQINDNVLVLSGYYGSNYPDFKSSGAGGKLFEGLDDFKNYMTGFDRVCITSTKGVIGAILSDHDGTVSGQFYTIPEGEKRLELIKAMNYEERVKEDYDEEDLENYSIEDLMETEFNEDLVYGGIEARDLTEHMELLVPIKDTFTGLTPDDPTKKTESEDIPNLTYEEDIDKIMSRYTASRKNKEINELDEKIYKLKRAIKASDNGSNTKAELEKELAELQARVNELEPDRIKKKEIKKESSKSVDRANALLDLFNEIYDGLGDMYAADEWAESLAYDYDIDGEDMEPEEIILAALNEMDGSAFKSEVDNLIYSLFEDNNLDYLKDTLHIYPRNLEHIIKCLNAVKPYASSPDKIDEAIVELQSVNMNLRTTAEEFQSYLHDKYKPWTVFGTTSGPRTYTDLFEVPTDYDIVGADYFNYANRPNDMLDHIGYGWKQDGDNIVADLIGFAHSVKVGDTYATAVYDQEPVYYGYSAVINNSNKKEKFKEMAEAIIAKGAEIKQEYGLGKKTESKDGLEGIDSEEYAVNIRSKSTNDFIKQYDCYETYKDAVKSAKEIKLADDETYEIVKIMYDENGNELGIDCVDTKETLEESYEAVTSKDTIGEIKEDGTVIKEYYGQGLIYKNFDNYNKKSGPCYISEYQGEKETGFHDRISEDELDTKNFNDMIEGEDYETYATIQEEIKIVFEQAGIETTPEKMEAFARDVFEEADWQSISALANEWIENWEEYEDEELEETKKVEEETIVDEINGAVDALKELDTAASLGLLGEDKETTGTITHELHTDLVPILNMNQYQAVPDELTYTREDLNEIMIEFGGPIIEEEIKSVFPNATVTFGKMDNPAYYRAFSNNNDTLDFTVTVPQEEYQAKYDMAVNNDDFYKFLKDTYKSYSGFVSFMADNIDDFRTQDDWKQFVTIITYFITPYARQEEFDEKVMEASFERFEPYQEDEELEESKAHNDDLIETLHNELNKIDTTKPEKEIKDEIDAILKAHIGEVYNGLTWEITNKDANGNVTVETSNNIQVYELGIPVDTIEVSIVYGQYGNVDLRVDDEDYTDYADSFDGEELDESKKLNEQDYHFLTPDNANVYANGTILAQCDMLVGSEDDLHKDAKKFNVEITETTEEPNGNYDVTIKGTLQDICNFIAGTKVDVKEFASRTDIVVMLLDETGEPRKKTESIEYITQKELDEMPEEYKSTVGNTIEAARFRGEDPEEIRKLYKDLGYDENDPMILANENGGTVLKPVKIKTESIASTTPIVHRIEQAKRDLQAGKDVDVNAIIKELKPDILKHDGLEYDVMVEDLLELQQMAIEIKGIDVDAEKDVERESKEVKTETQKYDMYIYEYYSDEEELNATKAYLEEQGRDTYVQKEGNEWALWVTYDQPLKDAMEEKGFDTSIDNAVWSAVCSNDINFVKNAYNKDLIKPGTRYVSGSGKHSMIMGALRNNQYEMVELLKSFGETIRKDEVEEYKSIMAKRTYEDAVTKSALEETKSENTKVVCPHCNEEDNYEVDEYDFDNDKDCAVAKAKCLKCDKEFRVLFKEEDVDAECPNCGDTFCSLGDPQDDVKSGTVTYDAYCDSCGESFYAEGTLEILGTDTVVTENKEEIPYDNTTEKECPVCKKKYTQYPALSRRDNKTYICPDCGVSEAMEDYMNYMKNQK